MPIDYKGVINLDISSYDVTWSSQSTDSSQSMPLGGFDTGCNVWVQDNILYLYVSESGTFDENNTMLKLCRIGIKPVDCENLFSGSFSQILHLEDGSITIKVKNDESRLSIRIWASVRKPEIHIECKSNYPSRFELSFQSWRYRRREVMPEERGQCRDLDSDIGNYPDKVFTEPDTVEASDEKLIFYHRNNDKTVWDLLIKQQHLEEISKEIYNPLFHRTMGGILNVPGMKYNGEENGIYANTDYCGYMFASKEPSLKQKITLTLLKGCFDSVDVWKKQLLMISRIRASFRDTKAWWKSYFERSYIIADEDHADSEIYRISRNYQLFRYMLGCNYYGEYPTKFNGGLFTFDTVFTPDYRMWSGGGFTLQNQRLVYWEMLKCGDFNEMIQQFEYFKRLTHTSMARVYKFLGFKGAFFNEQGNLFGICTGAEYNWKHDDRIPQVFEDSPYVRLHFSSALEFALMMLEYSEYSGRMIDQYLMFIENVIEFYFNYYKIGDDGKLCIFPSTALETYKGEDPLSKDDDIYGCMNPMDAVSGLHCVIKELLAYLERYDFIRNAGKIVHFQHYLEILPDMPEGFDSSGKRIYLPAEKYAPKPFNCELPELYPVFPYSPRGMDPHDAETARNTYFQPYASKDIGLGYSWHQNGIFAARLGLYKEAMKYLKIKLDDGPFRFPAFWGPGHDWMPDHNQGGSGMIGLQEMLMQCEGKKLRLLPCWDKNTDVSFRLFAPDRTCVECVWKHGGLYSLHVTPEKRMEDIVFGPKEYI
jgi:hypothetical protein